jgi:flagellar motor switch/type III secretory pathway protein FliN
MFEIGKDITEEKLAEKVKYGLQTNKANFSFTLGNKKIIIGKFDKFDKGGIIITDKQSKETVLYPIDLSKINRGFTFTRI